MLDQRDNFEKQFEPFGEDYVFHSNCSSGGRLVTKDEYDTLRAQRENVGRRSIFVVVAGAILAASAQMILDFPSSWLTIASYVLGAVIAAMIGWTSFAPSRLVRGRPAVVPPKTVAEMRRTVRSMMPWQMVILVIVSSALILGANLINRRNTLDWWLWTVGAGAMLAGYLWIGISKLRDK